jgi:hypothetical protein
MPSMTIQTDTAQATRLAVAVGEIHDYKDENGAPRAATPAEVKQHTIARLREDVLASEARARERASQSDPFEPT